MSKVFFFALHSLVSKRLSNNLENLGGQDDIDVKLLKNEQKKIKLRMEGYRQSSFFLLMFWCLVLFFVFFRVHDALDVDDFFINLIDDYEYNITNRTKGVVGFVRHHFLPELSCIVWLHEYTIRGRKHDFVQYNCGHHQSSFRPKYNLNSFILDTHNNPKNFDEIQIYFRNAKVSSRLVKHYKFHIDFLMAEIGFEMADVLEYLLTYSYRRF